MQEINLLQKDMLTKLTSFFKHRELSYVTQVELLKGKYADESDVYVLFKVGGKEIYIYGNGQLEICEGDTEILNLEVESYRDQAERERVFFSQLTELFGTYKR